jgi:cytochrome c-type biogenesis protein
MNELTYSLAFLAGTVSFISPCVLPLVPSYLSIISGLSFEELSSENPAKAVRIRTLFNSLIFVMGFSLVFITLGASSSLLGDFLNAYRNWLRIAGGILVITFGLFTAGVLNFDFLNRERRFTSTIKTSGPAGTFLMGVTFAACWTPCIGPILGSILLVASAEGSATYGTKLLAMYSAGLALPLLISSLAFNSFLRHSKTLYKNMQYVKMIGGGILILFGILMLLDRVTALTGFFPDFGISL